MTKSYPPLEAYPAQSAFKRAAAAIVGPTRASSANIRRPPAPAGAGEHHTPEHIEPEHIEEDQNG